jgi:hypothetical protein
MKEIILDRYPVRLPERSSEEFQIVVPVCEVADEDGTHVQHFNRESSAEIDALRGWLNDQEHAPEAVGYDRESFRLEEWTEEAL